MQDTKPHTPYYTPSGQHKKLPRGVVVLLLGIFLLSCAKQSYYDIDTRTDIEKDGNTVIRWQVNPGMEGSVKIFASHNASSYPTDPVAVERISKQFATIPYPAGNFEMQYFLMVFDGRETRVVSSRTLPTQSFTNLRDIGGYMTKEGEQVRWGLIYRGTTLSHLTEADQGMVAALGLKNLVILLDTGENGSEPTTGLNIRRFPLTPDKEYHAAQVREKILEGKMDRPAVIDTREKTLEDYAFNNPKQRSSALHFLLDRSNYPILLSDSLGNGRVAILTALIQSALGVPQREIINDYMLSNALTPVSNLEPDGYKYPSLVQESLIEYYRNRPNDLQYIFYRINRKYGSVERYLEQVLAFDKEDIRSLQEILLY